MRFTARQTEWAERRLAEIEQMLSPNVEQFWTGRGAVEVERLVIRFLLQASAMEARQGPDRETGLDGEAATARASQEASPEPSHHPRDPDNG